MSCVSWRRQGVSPRTTTAMVPTTMSTFPGAGSSSCLTRQVGCSWGSSWGLPCVPVPLVLLHSCVTLPVTLVLQHSWDPCDLVPWDRVVERHLSSWGRRMHRALLMLSGGTLSLGISFAAKGRER